jgi:amino acid adenylation domain-containing protein
MNVMIIGPERVTAPAPRLAHSSLPSLGGGLSEQVSLAALIAVLHRRTTQEAVRVARLDRDGTVCGAVAVEVPADLTFSQLCQRVEAALRADRATPPGPPAGGPFDAGHQFLPRPVAVSLPATASWLAGEPDDAGQLPAAIRVTPGHSEVMLAGGPDDDDATAAEVARQLRTVLEQVLAGSAGPLSALRLATTADRAAVLRFAGDGVAPAPAACVHDLVAAQAARTPGRTAVTCAGTTLTYRQLDERADQLASRLAAAGVGPDQVVGVLADRSAELIVILLGVLKAGGAYAAIDPALPDSRISGLLADTGARVVVAQRHTAGRVPGEAIALLADDAAGQPGAPSWRRRRVTPASLAYVSYTSGSTGVPKGAAIPHAAVSRLVREPDWADFRPDDVFLQLAPVAFDASTLEIWAPLTTGGRLAVFPPGRVDLDAVAETIRNERVTMLWLTAGLFHQLASVRPDAFGGLRHLLAGGDVVSPSQLTDVLQRNPGLTFTNGYGPTENTTFTACWTTQAPPPGNTVPIGPPISGTQALVLDPDLQPVPAGVPGELYAAGAGLARGYLGRPDATAEKFLPNPFGRAGERMYRTGDLAAWRRDGSLEFLGRADRQLKVQGFRVEPGEVEAVLLGEPGVHDAVVVAQLDGTRGKRLVAYVVADDLAEVGPSAQAAQLREAMRDRLPAYMVPWAIILLPELPLGHTGKVDRNALPPARRIARNLASGFVAARGPVEAHVADLWSDLLGIEPIGVTDDFFGLGGHSLIAAELLTEIQQAYDVEVSARTLYLHPTIRELAGAIEELASSAISEEGSQA